MYVCVNIDWLEVYCLESPALYPMNAEYFRARGYWVKERDYGTRVWTQMFTIMDDFGEPWIEVRREPASGNSDFKGLVPESCRLRLVNRQCYFRDCVARFRDFLALHDYQFRRIARIDICRDFVLFDSGDDPAAFCRRYMANKYSKVYQCQIAAHGNDGWASFDWESISWGSRTSMVTTKIYNKTKELQATGMKKPYIPQAWFAAHIIDNPLVLPDVWRVEFSINSHLDGWMEYEDIRGKRIRKRKYPHTLQMFDSVEKLCLRFEELAYHYFYFRHVEYIQERNSIAAVALEKFKYNPDRKLKRKDLCRDKVLFKINTKRDFCQPEGVAKGATPADSLEVLRKKLERLRLTCGDMQVRDAIDIIIKYITDKELMKYTPSSTLDQLRQLQLAIATRCDFTFEDTLKMASETIKLIKEGSIW